MERGCEGPRVYRMADFCFRVIGQPERVDSLLQEYLKPFIDGAASGEVPTFSLTLEAGPPPEYVLRYGETERMRWSTLALPFDQLLWEVGHTGIASVKGCLALHAGAVSWRRSGVIMPAPSGSGKSTLTAGLVRAGCSYLTDEAALIDATTGELVPYPRALWMHRSAVELLGDLPARLPPELADPATSECHVRPDDLRPAAVGGRCRLRLVVAPDFVEGAPIEVEPMSRSETVMTLIHNCFNFSSYGGRGLAVLGEVVRGAVGYRLRGGDLYEAVDAVLSLVDAAAPPGS